MLSRSFPPAGPIRLSIGTGIGIAVCLEAVPARSKLSLVASLIAASVACAATAQAALLVRVTESGGNVTATLSGSLDVSNPYVSGYWQDVGLHPSAGVAAFGPGTRTYAYGWTGLIDAPSNLVFGTANVPWVADSASGDLFVCDPLGTYSGSIGGQPSFYLPFGYGGGSLSGTLVFLGKSFADLGILPGTYTSGISGGHDSITYDISVPEIDPAGTGSVLALVAGALGLIERRRKRIA